MSSTTDLWTTAQERIEFEDQAELYAILKTCEYLEIAHARDVVEQTDYVEQCMKLIAQFKNFEKALIQRGTIASLQDFVVKYSILDCPRAIDRMQTGYPDDPPFSNVKLNNSKDDKKLAMSLVREMTELFIYLSNLLSLNRTAIDELLPQLEALLRSLNKAKSLITQGYDPTALEIWLKQMQSMKASDELNEEQTRQLLHDLNTSKAQIDDILSQS
jgi:ESCRT-I complex subunit VPS28